MRILIVDDSPATLAILHRGIERMGYNDIAIQKADNGHIALNMVREWEPNLIISDWHMPEMSGMELLSALKREMLGIDFGLITAESSEDNLREARDQGAQFILQKPFDTETLEKTIQPFIESYIKPHTKSVNGEGDGHSGVMDESDAKIILPHIDVLQKHLNALTSARVTVTKAPPIIMDKKHFPYIVGLYGQVEQASVHTVIVADIRAIAILGRLAGGLSMADIQNVLNKRISKEVLKRNQRVLHHIESLLFNMSTEQALALRDVKILKEPAVHIQKLLDSNSGDRLDTWLAMQGYNPGCFTIISS